MVLLGTVATLIVAGGGGYWWYIRASGQAAGSKSKPILELVARGPFDHVVLETGEIESSSNNEVKCEVKARGGSGTPILEVIPEGTIVKKGDFLCQLDSSALDQEAKTQRIAVSVAESTVISSRAAVEKAVISKQEYLEGTYLTERQAILSEISVAQQNLRKAELALQSAERLAAKGTLKPLQIEAEQFAVQNAKSTLESAQGRLRVLDELTKQKMLVQLDSDINTAKAKLESDETSLMEERDKLSEIQTQVDACNIRAPADGQVVYANKYGNRGGSDFVVEPGAYVREQQTIFLLPDPTRMQVKAKVNESRITLIREGMPVKIRVGAVDNDLFGRVVKVNKYAEPGNWFGPAVKEYAVFVQIIDPPREIRTGMTAEVRIFVEQIPDAIQIPILAVYETKRHHFVLVQSGSSFETRPIKIGGANDKFVTAQTGIKVGEQVVLNPRNHLDKMDLPEIVEQDDSEAFAKISADAPATASYSPAGEARSQERRNGSGPDIAAIVQAIFERLDTNSDGKISREEAQADSDFGARFDDGDLNKDGFMDKGELMSGMRKMMAARSAGGMGGPPGSRGSN
ncbi:HlyD family efflux transporter periplasmic adaptor subunit [Pirellulaceae bacterium SH449]